MDVFEPDPGQMLRQPRPAEVSERQGRVALVRQLRRHLAGPPDPTAGATQDNDGATGLAGRPGESSRYTAAADVELTHLAVVAHRLGTG